MLKACLPTFKHFLDLPIFVRRGVLQCETGFCKTNSRHRRFSAILNCTEVYSAV